MINPFQYFYVNSTGLDLYIFSQSPGGYQVLKFGRQMEILLANFLGKNT
jgi:hypothetical protein